MRLDDPPSAWAKARRDADGGVISWHSLVDHSADVAACLEAALAVPLPAARLAALANRRSLPAVWTQRLCALAALHDFGKVNRGFRARWRPNVPLVGHCAEAVAAVLDDDARAALARVLPFEEILNWGADRDALLAVLAHHGRPLPLKPHPPKLVFWRAGPDYDPFAALAPHAAAVRLWFPEAFAQGGEPLPAQPGFWHAFLGLLTFADWLGSDESLFPHADGAAVDRMGEARARARRALRRIGFDPQEARAGAPAPSFARMFGFTPLETQNLAGELKGRLAILEAETGSGKTEAALWRFATLFARGEVDGLYFALPTRVSAVAMHARVAAAIERLFPDPSRRPPVTLAIPGLALGETPGDGLEAAAPDETEDAREARTAARWASERPKRFLAGTIAVGTIDQALLGAIKAKHAHLRASCLLRHLLVVDEVHSSDAYMGGLLAHLLRFHASAGGHALLLSATLGAAARTRLLRGEKASAPSLDAALAAPYPALWSEDAPEPLVGAGAGRTKRVEMRLVAEIDDPAALARRATAAAREGAKVLVIRNLRRDAVATWREVLAQGAADLMFSCEGVPTLHHGRFAREDRMALDAAVETSFGKTRAPGGRIVIGTQTLEISLDIDADLLLTDLCPADVLLQRLGRLHRHERPRPAGFETPRAVVLSPPSLAPLLKRGAHGMGFFGESGAYPYPDLVALEATRRLAAEHPVWTIPAMNRFLVERATHPQAREALLLELKKESGWAAADMKTLGRDFAFENAAKTALLRNDLHFDEAGVIFPSDESFATRLGARDLLIVFPPGVTGPFGRAVTQILLPDYWARGIDPTGDLTPQVTPNGVGGFEFQVQGVGFLYNKTGLSKN